MAVAEVHAADCPPPIWRQRTKIGTTVCARSKLVRITELKPAYKRDYNKRRTVGALFIASMHHASGTFSALCSKSDTMIEHPVSHCYQVASTDER